MQFHFVVVYDSSTDTWSVEDGTANARFQDGLMYDPAVEEWSDPYGDPRLEAIDAKASKELAALLETRCSVR